jgi:hypothetical protein
MVVFGFVAIADLLVCSVAPRATQSTAGSRWRGTIDRPLPAWTAYISHNNFSSRPVALTVAQTVAAVIEKGGGGSRKRMQSSTPRFGAPRGAIFGGGMRRRAA